MAESKTLGEAILVPQVYTALNTRYVLVTEWVEGVKVRVRAPDFFGNIRRPNEGGVSSSPTIVTVPFFLWLNSVYRVGVMLAGHVFEKDLEQVLHSLLYRFGLVFSSDVCFHTCNT